jgi:hypothetical protein
MVSLRNLFRLKPHSRPHSSSQSIRDQSAETPGQDTGKEKHNHKPSPGSKSKINLPQTSSSTENDPREIARKSGESECNNENDVSSRDIDDIPNENIDLDDEMEASDAGYVLRRDLRARLFTSYYVTITRFHCAPLSTQPY